MDAGVDVSAIKTDVEVELRLVGLKIVESSNATTAQIVDRNSICLEVDLNGTVNPDKQSISYLTTIKVIQQVRLLRNPSRLTTGTTWEFGQFGYAGLGTLSKSGEIVDKGIKSFLNDYLTANPKPSRVTLPPSAK